MPVLIPHQVTEQQELDEEKSQEYSRRMRDAMGWEDRPYDYHYSVSKCAQQGDAYERALASVVESRSHRPCDLSTSRLNALVSLNLANAERALLP